MEALGCLEISFGKVSDVNDIWKVACIWVMGESWQRTLLDFVIFSTPFLSLHVSWAIVGVDLAFLLSSEFEAAVWGALQTWLRTFQLMCAWIVFDTMTGIWKWISAYPTVPLSCLSRDGKSFWCALKSIDDISRGLVACLHFVSNSSTVIFVSILLHLSFTYAGLIKELTFQFH